MKKHIVFHSCNAILLNNKKEKTIGTHDNLDTSQRHHAEKRSQFQKSSWEHSVTNVVEKINI